MTGKKKRLRYSELAPAGVPVAAPAPPPAVPPPAIGPAAAAPQRRSAPVDLARALAAARAREQAGEVPAAASAAASVRAPAPPASPRRETGLRPLRDRARERTGMVDVLLFRVADEQFGIELAAVEEAIDLPPVHHVPEMPPAMLGVVTVRGTLTPVYSPAPALGLTLHDGASALIFRRGRARLAVVVDEVDDVMPLDLALLRDAPALEAGDTVVLGVVRQGDALYALVEADALLAACRAVPLLETA